MRRDLLRKYAACGGADPAQETNKVQTHYSFPVQSGSYRCPGRERRMPMEHNQYLPEEEYHRLHMKELPEDDRPYEKCWKYGAASLSDAQLLAAVLRTGVKGETALDLAHRLLQDDRKQGLSLLHHVSVQELTAMRGIGKVKAIQLKCIAELSHRMARQELHNGLIFRDPETIAAYYMEKYRHEEQEHVLLLMLDSKCMLIGEQVLFKGTVNLSVVSPREIFITALRFQAVSIILLHNHPSGDPSPSKEDLLITERVRSCGEMLGIELADHIIIGDHAAVSFRSQALL